MSAPGPVSNPLSREARDAMREARIAQLETALAAMAEKRDEWKKATKQAMEMHDAERQGKWDAEALVSTLGQALHTVWLVTEDCTQYREEDEQLHAISETARAALASYQEWDRANPSTGEGTE